MKIVERIRSVRPAHRRTLRVAIAGGREIAGLVVRGYHRSGFAEIAAVYHEDGDVAEARAAEWGASSGTDRFASILADDRVQAVEILSGPQRRCGLAMEALDRGKHVSLLKPMATSIEEAQGLVEKAGSVGRVLRVLDPLLYYAPYAKARDLIRSREVGEPSMIRVKTQLGGIGGWGPELSTGTARAQLFAHPCLDKSALIRYLFGPVEKVSGWLEPLDPKRGGSSLLMCKHIEAGRYGVMDLTYSPGLRMRASYYPCYDEVEITGTDGYIWVKGGTARMTDEPAIIVRGPHSYRHIGIESGIEDDWADSFTTAAEAFALSIAARRPDPTSGREGVEALRFLIAACRASETGSEVALRSIA